MLRNGLSAIGIVTWLLLGGRHVENSDMAQVRNVEDVAGKFLCSMTDFLMDAVTGCSVRIECVVSGKTSSEVLSLMGTDGSRLVEFCVSRKLLVYSTKNWPYYVDGRITTVLRQLGKLIDVAHKEKLDRNVCIFFTIFPIGLMWFLCALTTGYIYVFVCRVYYKFTIWK